MRFTRLLPPAAAAVFCFLLAAADAGGDAAGDERLRLVAGEVGYDWVGNTFAAGLGGPDDGRWVQNFVERTHVTAGGVVFAGAGWDEAGRCLGLYLDGDTNTPLIGQSDRRGGHTAWGYGTANQSFAVDGEAVLLHNTAGEVVRFRWTPGDIDSVRYVSTHALPPVVGDGGEDEVGDDRRPAADDEALHWERREAMAIRGDTLVLVRDGRRVEVFDAVTLERRGGFGADELRDVCFGSADTLWLIEGDAVVERRLTGERTGRRIDDAGRPWRWRWRPTAGWWCATPGRGSRCGCTTWRPGRCWSRRSASRAGWRRARPARSPTTRCGA